MAKCAISGKTVKYGRNVSHSNRKTSRTVKPNLQTARIEIDGVVKKVKVAARALKSGKIKRVI